MGVTGTPERGLLRTVLTVLCVLLVVSSEFLLLDAVFDRAAPLRTERVAAARLEGELQVLGSHGQITPAQVALVDAQIARLHASGLSGAAAAGVEAATAVFRATPDDLAARSRLGAATVRLGVALRAHQHELVVQTRGIYVALLVAVSIGWFGWFRRVVRRQRGLQERLTQQLTRSSADQRLAAVVHSASDLVLVMDPDSVVSFATPSSLSVLGVPAEELVGRRFTDALGGSDELLFRELLLRAKPGVERRGELRVQREEHDDRALDVEVRDLLGDGAVGGLVVTVRDVTERRRFETELSRQAFHDQLTGLANRRLFADRLSHALLRRPEDEAAPHAVLFCDLDEFKTVNDSLGHGVGDLVLAETGRRLAAGLRTGDTAARLGGDEFAVLIEHIGSDDALGLAADLIERIAQPMEINGMVLQVGVSIGVTEAVPGVVTADEALRNADLAVYRAKAEGRGRAALYEPRLHVAAVEHLQLRTDLQRALREGELRAYLQPQVDLRTETLSGFEALVRWEHPTRGLLPPAAFLSIAEEGGLMLALDRWMLGEGLRIAAGFGPDSPLLMSVNLSGALLTHPNLDVEVLAAIEAAGVPPRRLVVEITESSLLPDLSDVTPRLQALRAAGVAIAIDDFGTGFSSLAYLHRLPVDILKIDRSFVERVTGGAHEASVTDAIVTLAQRLDLHTVAEGIERVDQVAWLLEAGCHVGQGFLWSRPIPAAEAVLLTLAGVRDAPLPRVSDLAGVPALAPAERSASTAHSQSIPAF